MKVRLFRYGLIYRKLCGIYQGGAGEINQDIYISTHNDIDKISLGFIRDEVGEIFFIVHEELFYQDCRGIRLISMVEKLP